MGRRGEVLSSGLGGLTIDMGIAMVLAVWLQHCRSADAAVKTICVGSFERSTSSTKTFNGTRNML